MPELGLSAVTNTHRHELHFFLREGKLGVVALDGRVSRLFSLGQGSADRWLGCALLAVIPQLVGPVVCNHANHSRLSTRRVAGLVRRRTSKSLYRGAAGTAPRSRVSFCTRAMSESEKPEAKERAKQMDLLNMLVPEEKPVVEEAPKPIEPEVAIEEPQKAEAEEKPSFFQQQEQPQQKRQVVDEETFDTSFSDRAISSLAYSLPLLDSLRYSKFLLMQFPDLSLAHAPLIPVSKLYFSLGFLSQILFFFGIYFGIGQNRELNPYVRFNAMQAVVLDILLILPDVLSGLVSSNGGGSTELEILYNNFVFLYVYVNAVYACFYTVQGKKVSVYYPAPSCCIYGDFTRSQAEVRTLPCSLASLWLQMLQTSKSVRA